MDTRKYETKDSMPQHIDIFNNSKVPLGGVAPGSTKKIRVDKEGTPLDQFWRKRLEDSKIDNAIVIAEEDVKTEVKMEIKKESKLK